MNQNKRLKKYTKEVEYLYGSNPNYKKVKDLYARGEVKSIPSALKLLKSIKYTKKGTLFKGSAKKQQDLEAMYNDAMGGNKKKIDKAVVAKAVKKVTINTILNEKIGAWYHAKQIKKMMTLHPGCLYIHEVKFYDGNNNLVRDNKTEFTRVLTQKELEETGTYTITFRDSAGLWEVEDFLNEINDSSAYVEIITTAYRKFTNTNEQLRLIQKFRINETNDCVYQCLLNFFEKFEGTKNKDGISILRKLLNNKRKYSKPYTIEDIEKLGQELQLSITIKDLVNNKDIQINKKETNKYNIELLNTRYNHVELFKTPSNIQEIGTTAYDEIKLTAPFYVENMGTLMTSDASYKIKNDFKTLFNDWKLDNKINSCSIPIGSDINNFINQYDDKVHRFFNSSMTIDDSLYEEMDLKKAYYNYNKARYYIGLPSGSYISSSGEGMNYKTFSKQYNNNLVGWYDVIITHDNKVLNHIGLTSGSRHTLFTSELKVLHKRGVKFEFKNYVISPTIDKPFSSEFLKYIDGDKLVEEKPKDKDTTKAYCKAVGLMMIESIDYTVNVKPEANDKEYHKILHDQSIYDVNGIYKIVRDKENPTSLKHMALSIHAYSNSIILDQLLQFENHEDIIGVKVDSIVYKVGAKYEMDSTNELFKESSKSNIESMLKNESYSETPTYSNSNDLDWFPEDGVPHGSQSSEEIINDKFDTNTYFKPYYINQLDQSIEFEPSFCGKHITKQKIFIGGAGGTGKTTSVLASSNFIKSDILFTSICWELIQGKMSEYEWLHGTSIPKITGQCNISKGGKSQKQNIDKFKYILIDELTMIHPATLNKILDDNPNKFIIMMGDVDEDGKFYQCSLSTVVNPSELNCQYIQYTKTYRFNEELNNILQDLRTKMKDRTVHKYNILNYVKKIMPNNFVKKSDVIFTNKDIGITPLQPIDKEGNCKYSDYFYENNSPKQYYIADTKININKDNVYKGQILDSEPTDHNNYVCSLFKTIHAYQGRQLNDDNKIVILMNSLFDFNLFYTALSRAKRLDQIIIIDDLPAMDRVNNKLKSTN